jgi:hypothetical protein
MSIVSDHEVRTLVDRELPPVLESVAASIYRVIR